jgi:hypothetical protein
LQQLTAHNINDVEQQLAAYSMQPSVLDVFRQLSQQQTQQQHAMKVQHTALAGRSS